MTHRSVRRSAAALAAMLFVAVQLAASTVARAADIDPAWLGAWIGSATTAARASLPTTLTIAKDASGAITASVTSIAMGALDKPATAVSADGKTLSFKLGVGPRTAQFEATVADDGKSATGSLTILAANAAAAQPAMEWRLRRIDRVSEVANARAYTATLDALGQKLPMRLSLGEGPHGWCAEIDITIQGLKGHVLETERLASGAFKLTLANRVNAVLELTPSADMNSLEGTFEQGSFRGPVRFEFAEGDKAGPARRPQDPAPNPPYTSIDVRIPCSAGHTLAGTLSLPSDKRLTRAARFPAVVLVSGSGPQNRDEELMGHRPFAVIADSLARAGIAVLRYDDRGVGASTGSFDSATTVDFARDADAASAWLKARAEIDPDRVGMLGHSEGALIAPIVAAWQNAGDAPVHPLAFTVLLAPPAENGLETLVRQTARMYEVAQLDPAKIAAAATAQRAALAAAANGADEATLRPLVEALVRAQLAFANPGTDAQVAALADAAVKQLASPWLRAFIALDPRGAIERGEVPTLAMWGAKDVQVVADANRAAFEKLAAAAHAPLDARTYDGLNHLFQPASTGLPDEYATIDTTFDPSTLAEMTEWISQAAKSAPAKQIPEASRPAGWNAAPLPAREVAP